MVSLFFKLNLKLTECKRQGGEAVVVFNGQECRPRRLHQHHQNHDYNVHTQD